MKIVPGVHRIELPLPFSLSTVNVYLAPCDDGYLLIDCGMDTPGAWETLERSMAEDGVSWPQVNTVLLTHMHPDHVGLAPRVLERSGAKLMMHSEDSELLALFSQDGATWDWNQRALTAAGSPGEMITRVHEAFETIARSFPRLEPDTLLHGGEHIGSLEVLWTPGHSPGHLCLYEHSRQLLFSGDHILERISPNIAWIPDEDPLGNYLSSLRQIREIDVELVFPSHGVPFAGHRTWIDRTIAHHDARCRTIAQLTGSPRTAHELIGELWNDLLPAFQYRFAVFEVLAHLEHLVRKDIVHRNGILWQSSN